MPEPLVNGAPAWTAWRELGDKDTAGMELDAARVVFEQLGAAPDLARVASLVRRATSAEPWVDDA
jgi:hypothetical protein